MEVTTAKMMKDVYRDCLNMLHVHYEINHMVQNNLSPPTLVQQPTLLRVRVAAQ